MVVNGPILSGALASLGIETVCIGMLDGCEDVLKRLRTKAECYSIGKCNQCTAVEFDDGKIMLGTLESMDLDWTSFSEKMPEEKLCEIMKESNLFGIVNWSAFLNINDIIEEMEKNSIFGLEWKIYIFRSGRFFGKGMFGYKKIYANYKKAWI